MKRTHTVNVDQKNAVRTALRKLKKWRTYDQLVDYFEVNRKELNLMIRFDHHDPPAWVWQQLGVQVYALAPICPKCGVAHSHDCTVERVIPIRKKEKPRNRRAINLNDYRSAYNTIKDAYQNERVTKGFIHMLGFLLTEYYKEIWNDHHNLKE